MAQWFYRNHHGQEHGPMAGAQLLDLIRRGDVEGHTEVRKDSSPWIPACQVNGLWQAVGRPSVEFKCPHCGGPIEKPPTVCGECRKEISKAVGHLIAHAKPKDHDHHWTTPVHGDEKPKAPPLCG